MTPLAAALAGQPGATAHQLATATARRCHWASPAEHVAATEAALLSMRDEGLAVCRLGRWYAREDYRRERRRVESEAALGDTLAARLAYLATPRTPAECAAEWRVERSTAVNWLRKAAQRGDLTRQPTQPPRYVAAACHKPSR